MGERRGRALGAVVAASALLLLAACGDGAPNASGEPTSSAGTPAVAEAETGAPAAAAPSAVADPDHAVDAPGPLDAPLLPADMLVYSQQPLSAEMVDQIGGITGVTETEQLSMAQVAIENRVITLAAVDPGSYRRFTPVNSAQLEDIWTRVAGGELAILPALGRKLQGEGGFLQLGNDQDAPEVHIGAYAPQIPRVDAVVNEKWADTLGMRIDNALLISTGMTSPQSVRKPIQRIVGSEASVQILGPDLDITATQTAFLTGGSVATAVGTFGYRVIGGGRIAPDQAWVTANIRTEQVPILGTVTCHRVMLPQLRAALTEITTRGLADTIDPREYAGCYYPRFIAGSTQLSLHSFGIAVDLNTPGNQRGTVGEMDRTVVSIFKKWGFGWGGDWGFTDPMHFEMNRTVEAR